MDVQYEVSSNDSGSRNGLLEEALNRLWNEEAQEGWILQILDTVQKSIFSGENNNKNHAEGEI